MTNKKGIGLVNARILVTMLIAASIIFVVTGSQNAMASICPPMCVDVDIEESAEAGNATMMTNQTAEGNMTTTNSSS